METHRTRTKPLVVALTGSIGTGKSAAAQILEKLGATVIDADLLAREAVEKGSAGLGKVVARFGPAMLLPNGELDRKRLGELIFRDPSARSDLESIVHPEVRRRFLSRLTSAKEDIARHPDRPALIVYVVPLLFESQNPIDSFDKIVVVSASRENSLQRIVRRDSCSLELAEKKLSAQLPIEEKVRRADFVIANDGSLEDLTRETTALFRKILATR